MKGVNEMIEEQQQAVPRTEEQVHFVANLSWEEQEAMYRQCIADGGMTMSYSERAREVLQCIATNVDDRLSARERENLEAIGSLLIIWEGSLHLLEAACKRAQDESAARGALLDIAAEKLKASSPSGGNEQ